MPPCGSACRGRSPGFVPSPSPPLAEDGDEEEEVEGEVGGPGGPAAFTACCCHVPGGIVGVIPGGGAHGPRSKTEVPAKTKELVSQKILVRTPELHHEGHTLEKATLEQDEGAVVQQEWHHRRNCLPLPWSTTPALPNLLAQLPAQDRATQEGPEHWVQQAGSQHSTTKALNWESRCWHSQTSHSRDQLLLSVGPLARGHHRAPVEATP